MRATVANVAIIGLIQPHIAITFHEVFGSLTYVAMGQEPVHPVNIPIPTKIGSKMGGTPTNQNGIPLVLTHRHVELRDCATCATVYSWHSDPPEGLRLRG